MTLGVYCNKFCEIKWLYFQKDTEPVSLFPAVRIPYPGIPLSGVQVFSVTGAGPAAPDGARP